MPGGDGTGPRGMGPMTGRAAGYCAGYSVPGFMNSVPAQRFGYGRGWGRGFGGGRGRGRGRGWQQGYYAAGAPGWVRPAYGAPAFGAWANPYMTAPEMSAQDEKVLLKQESEALQQQLQDIQSRIATLEKAQTQENT